MSDTAPCTCGHPSGIHLVPDYSERGRRVCFVLACPCEGFVASQEPDPGGELMTIPVRVHEAVRVDPEEDEP